MTKTNITTAYQKLLELIETGRCYEVTRDGMVATCKIDRVVYLSPNTIDYRWKTKRFCSKFDEFLTLDEAKKKRKSIRDGAIKEEIKYYEEQVKKYTKELDKWKKRLSAN